MMVVFKKGKSEMVSMVADVTKVPPGHTGITLATAKLQLEAYPNPTNAHEEHIKARALTAIAELTKSE